MEFQEIVEYYSKPLVRKEMVEYSRGRWIAIHTLRGGLTGLFVRYWSKTGPPLHISKEEDLDELMRRFRGLWPRTFYASINVYSRVLRREDVENPENILYTTPVWDVDGSLEYWPKVVDVARVIVEGLEKEGVSKSVYLKWSGRGIHIHLHEKAFSSDVLSKHHPLDIAYSIVDYILKKCTNKIVEIIKDVTGGERPLKVENEIDLKRVFTVPLSLHKSLDYAVICFKPDEIDDFNPEWAKPNILKHNSDWRNYSEGEADQLALKAMKEIGGYFKRVGEIRTVVQTVKPTITRKVGRKPVMKVGRFQVMALLQAARYYLLTGDLEKAKSFGLNRAIFYAWAKYHGRDRVFRRKITDVEKPVEHVVEKGRKLIYVGDEGSFISERGWFIIGDKEQLPSDYDKEIARKIDSVVPYNLAWEKAVEYLKRFPKNVLLSQRKFYEAYKKVRDVFIDKIVKGEGTESTLS